MSDKLYSIKESTLTDIGDALRRKHGETKIETIIEDEIIPSVIISKTPNATGFDSYNGLYEEDIIEKTTFSVYQIPNASTIKIKVAYQFSAEAGDYLEIASGNFPNSTEWQWATGSKICRSLSNNGIQIKEFEFANTDVITLRLMIYKTYHSHFYLGYYAEITGYDADGNLLGEQTIQVEKEVELPNTYASDEMAKAIDDIEDGVIPPEEAFNITGTCSYRFYNNAWNWFIEMFGDKITTNNIDAANGMFQLSGGLKDIPFDLNFNNIIHSSYQNLFVNCMDLTSVGKLINMYPNNTNSLFSGCQSLRYLPEFINMNYERLQTYSYANMSSMFQNCYSLREIPEDFLREFYGVYTSPSYSLFYNGFQNCYVLDEIRGLNPNSGAVTTNMLGNAFNNCNRLKDIIFVTQDDGTPYSVKWKSQTIEMSNLSVGYASPLTKIYICSNNSGITEDKEVKDDATYQALKNDADWWTADVSYSRYNHDSAVNTINSLPDTSAYLATAGGTNTIKFKKESGANTDGGAISTLTAEEIAVAAARGWTVTLV